MSNDASSSGKGVKRSESLVNASKKWTHIFEAIAHPAFILSPDHTIMAANRATTKILNLPTQEIVGRKCYEMFHSIGETRPHVPDSCPCRRIDCSSSLETEQMEMEALGRHFVVACTPVFDESGRLEQIIHIATDITATKAAESQKAKLEQQLIQAQKMESIGKLAGSIAHDFNNLLLPILAYSEMLSKDLSMRDPRQHNLQQIKSAVERARNLTQQLLVFSRHQILDLQVLNINRVVTNFEAMFRSSIAKNITLNTVLAPERLTFMGDITQVERMLMNLVINAQDAMQKGGILTIETSSFELKSTNADEHPDLETGSYVVISVRDTGFGIETEMQKHIFEPFFTTKASQGGTGLGLSTVFGIAKQHKGKITVDSSVGKGSVFRVYFPRKEGRASSAEGQTNKKEIPKGSETLLVVEDDDTVRETVNHLLAGLGYKVLNARDGNSGLKIAIEHDGPIDLLLTDLLIPNMNGKELYQKFHCQRPKCKVLYMSGFTDTYTSGQEVSLDHADFISKPFTIHMLSKKIRDLLDN